MGTIQSPMWPRFEFSGDLSGMARMQQDPFQILIAPITVMKVYPGENKRETIQKDATVVTVSCPEGEVYAIDMGCI
jgi:hypothetical protein